MTIFKGQIYLFILFIHLFIFFIRQNTKQNQTKKKRKSYYISFFTYGTRLVFKIKKKEYIKSIFYYYYKTIEHRRCQTITSSVISPTQSTFIVITIIIIVALYFKIKANLEKKKISLIQCVKTD